MGVLSFSLFIYLFLFYLHKIMKKILKIKEIVSWEGQRVYTLSYDFDSKSMDMIT